MNHLDDQLRSALRRQDPSPDFAARVLQRAEGRGRRRSAWAAAAIAATLTLVFAGFTEYREREQEQAGRQAMVALRIAAEKLNHVRDRVVAQSSNSERNQ